MIQRPIIRLTALLLSVAVAPAVASADGFALKDYILEDVVAIAYADFEKLETRTLVELFKKLDVEKQELADVEFAMQQLDGEILQLNEVGIQTAFALIRTSDLNQRGTSLVFPVDASHDVGIAADKIREIFKKAQLHKVFNKVQGRNGAVLAAANVEQMQRLAEQRPKVSRNLDQAWEGLGQGTLGVLVFGDDASRKVVSELIPNLPEPFESLTGNMVAENLLWGGIELQLGQQIALKIEIEASDSETATKVADVLGAGTEKLIQQLPQVREILPDKIIDELVDAMKPVVKERRVTIALDSITGDMDRLTNVLAKPVSAARQAARLQSELNQIRQLALAILNYEAAFSRFPNPFGVTEQTPGGLSWRVQILPFIEENKLYEQFKLDEPWNSEHNLKLVIEMPQVFKSPVMKGAKFQGEGKTIFQVPVGEGTAFDKESFEEKGLTFGDFKDGTSNTILIVTVAPEKAVIWTKPADWEVNLDEPWTGLRAEERGGLTVAHADSSAHRYPFTIKPEVLRALITKSGGEIVPSSVK